MSLAAWLLVAALAAALSALGGVFWQARLTRRERDALQARWQSTQGELERLQDEVKAQQAIIYGLGDHLQTLEKRLRKLEAQRISLPNTGGKSYQEAVRMLQDGFGDREIIDLCGITQGELTLIKNLYRTDPAD